MLKNIALAVVTTILCLVLVELGYALLKKQKETVSYNAPKEYWVSVPERTWTEHHPVLGWYHEKNKKAVYTSDRGEIDIHTNSDGLRGEREYAVPKPEDVVRILTVSDSFLFGWAVRDQDVFSAQIESRYDRLEMPNLSVAGYGVDQFLMAYRSIGQKYEADYVMIGIFPEDFWRATRAFADSGHAKPYFSLSSKGELKLHNVPVPPPYTLKTNQFPEVIEVSPFQAFMKRTFLYPRIYRKLIKLGKNLRVADPDSSDEWILGREILKALIVEIRQNGSKPVIAVVPPNRWMDRKKPEAIHRSLLLFSARNSVDLIDLTPVFQEAVKTLGISEYYIEGDGHWTEKGQVLAAKTIESYFVEKERLLTPRVAAA